MANNPKQIQHIGVIMDGNRRWAKQHMLESVIKGHEKGVDKFMELCMWCQEARIPFLTVYAFSYDNWNRTQDEVTALFDLMQRFFVSKVDTCIKRDIRLIPIGNFEKLSENSRKTLQDAAKLTENCKTLTVNVAISYGGHDETLRVAKAIASDCALGKISACDINDALYKKYLDLGNIPDMDLVIRTGGDKRLSGFFPWETAYSECAYVDALWPDFSHEMFDFCLDEYYAKTRINNGK